MNGWLTINLFSSNYFALFSHAADVEPSMEFAEVVEVEPRSDDLERACSVCRGPLPTEEFKKGNAGPWCRVCVRVGGAGAGQGAEQEQGLNKKQKLLIKRITWPFSAAVEVVKL
jgi:hypothetical protein